MTLTPEQKKEQLKEETWKKIKELMLEPEFRNVDSTILLQFGNRYQDINTNYSMKLSKLKKEKK